MDHMLFMRSILVYTFSSMNFVGLGSPTTIPKWSTFAEKQIQSVFTGTKILAKPCDQHLPKLHSSEIFGLKTCLKFLFDSGNFCASDTKSKVRSQVTKCDLWGGGVNKIIFGS